MTTVFPISPEQQISEPSSYAKVLGRFSVPNAPAQVAAFSDGRVVAVYEYLDPMSGVLARIISPDGSLSPEILVEGGSSSASVTVLPDFNNDFIVAFYQGGSHGHILAKWYQQDGTQKVARLQLVEGFANPSGTRVISVSAPSVSTQLPDGRFAVVWLRNYQSPANLETYHQYCIYNPNKLTPTTTNPQISIITSLATTVNYPFNACIQIAPAQYGSNLSMLLAYKYNGKVAADHCLPDGSNYTSFDLGNGQNPTIAGLRNGNCVIAWHDLNLQNNVYFSIHSTDPNHFPSISDTPITSGQVNQSSYADRPALAVLTSGKFVVAWESYGIRGRVFNDDGSPATDEFVLHSDHSRALAPSIVATPNGGFYAVFMCNEGNLHPPVHPENPIQWVIKGQAWGVA
jgi:hypothetical protein